MKTYNNSASLELTKRLSDMVNVARESGELMERDKDCKRYFFRPAPTFSCLKFGDTKTFRIFAASIVNGRKRHPPRHEALNPLSAG